jgi:hypothetical protein
LWPFQYRRGPPLAKRRLVPHFGGFCTPARRCAPTLRARLDSVYTLWAL